MGKHPMEALIRLLRTWGNTFAEHQKIIAAADKTFADRGGLIFSEVWEHALRHEKRIRASKMDVEIVDANHHTARVTYDSSLGLYYNVRLDAHTCDCGRYQERHYPCVHAVAAAAKFKLSSAAFAELFSPIFRIGNIRKAYQTSIVVPSKSMVVANEAERLWPTLHFTQEPRGVGRQPKNKRVKSIGECPANQIVSDFGSSNPKPTAPKPMSEFTQAFAHVQAPRADTLLFFPS
jgi:hypothetical protein